MTGSIGIFQMQGYKPERLYGKKEADLEKMVQIKQKIKKMLFSLKKTKKSRKQELMST